MSYSATLQVQYFLAQSAIFLTIGYPQGVPTRAENRTRTLVGLGDAAVELIEKHGPSVTIDQIAERAGVSRRTVFRHVESKEELVFVEPILWFGVFDEALDHDIHPLTERLRLASRAIGEYIDANPERPRRSFLLAATHPELLRGFNAVYQRWVDRMSAEALIDIDEPTAQDRFRARVIGSAIMGMVDAVTREWLLSPTGEAFTDIHDRGFGILEPLFSQDVTSLP